MLVTFFLCYYIFSFFFVFFVFVFFKTQIDYLFLKDVIIHATLSYLLQISSGTPSKCMFWLHLTIFWVTVVKSFDILSINWNIDPRICPFLFVWKHRLFYTTRKYKALGSTACTIEGWQDYYTLVYDQMKLSWFKIIEWCHGFVDLTKTWWHGPIPKKIYITKATLGFERNPKEFAWATNIRCTLLSQLYLGIFHELLVE